MTDFGIPKVIGGNFNMLATDVFKLVIGQQDFQRGAVVGLLLLTPAVLTFGIDWLVQRKQTAMLSARAVPLPAAAVARLRCADARATASSISALMLAMIGMAVFASFATYWPYNLAPSLKHYTMGLVDAEVGDAFVNSLKLAAGHRVLRHRSSSSSAPTCSRRRAALRRAAAAGAAAGDAADGGAGAGARPRLHLLLQRARQPAATACTRR